MNYKHLLWLLAPCALIGYCTMPCLTERCKAQEAWYAKNVAWREEYNRRNVIQPGDRYPQNYDYQKYAMIKIANRYLMWPSEYGSDRRIVYFWPSKTPTIQMPQPTKEGRINVFFTDPYSHMPKDHYNDLLAARKDGRIIQWHSIRRGLDEVNVKNRGVYYLATDYKNYKNQPPTLFCQLYPPNIPVNKNALDAKSEDMWNGIIVAFEFSNAYCQNWPEIYQHGMSIIKNNVKEALL